MKIFPDLFKSVFTSKELCCQDVISKIIPIGSLNNDDKKMDLVTALFDYLSGLSPEGQYVCLWHL